ncbi:uncharacterized protein FIESC28_09780 [Fusarium coffeatum]|uniref:Uncharacterized protein n=1 Tax=Fusarium coffeatum TaxID=231269 RepID=A0A366R026_9HYPO|nr:uncharacterized protein FIESC28_09780 [Fusarium coffeatum]RBR09610.1 hypothetical protein FIESC28_09780 [Fusarium coffeatum]
MPHTNVFTDFEEEVMFAGRNSETVVRKLQEITFEDFEDLSQYRFFQNFILSLPGKPTFSATERFRRLKHFAKAKVVVYKLRAEVKIAADWEERRVVVTPSGSPIKPEGKEEQGHGGTRSWS